MSDNIYVKNIKALGEIPEGVLGFLRANSISHAIDYTHVYVPWKYTGLDKKELPCYDMPGENERATYWVEILEEMLTDEEKQLLSELESEINKREKFFLGPNGIFIKTMGEVDGTKLNDAIKNTLERLSDK
jgi:hypothetical protein